MVNFKYWCFTDECFVKDLKNGYIIEKEESEEHKEERCPDCGEILKLAGRVAPGVLKFNSMSPQEKSQVLKQRSKVHFQKDIKERRTDLNSRQNLNTD